MHRLMLASILLLLLTNIVVLSGVAYNRSGEPLASIMLTERELPMQYYYSRNEEDSSTQLALNWQVLKVDMKSGFPYGRYRNPEWLTDAKLIELGFDLERLKNDRDIDRYRWDTHAIDAVLVLEYEGESYQDALALTEKMLDELRETAAADSRDKSLAKQLKRYEDHLLDLKVSATRLYVIDVGLDEEALIEKYTDRSKYLFLRGEVGLSWHEENAIGHIRYLYIEDIHVALPYSQQLEQLTEGDSYYRYSKKPIPPRYKVKLNIGKRLEPWVEWVR